MRLIAPTSTSLTSCAASCLSPPVSAKTSGLPLRSVRKWIFVPNPPRLRPNPRRAPFFPPTARWARSPYCQRSASPSPESFPIGLSLKRFEDLVQRYAAIDKIEWRSSSTGHVRWANHQRRTGTNQPEDRIEKPPMANRRPSARRFFRRPHRFYARSMLVREAMSWHSLKKIPTNTGAILQTALKTRPGSS
jgi:hypothetical protein